MKKTYGIIAVILGVICIGLSSYIKSQVEAGQEEISSAQRKVDRGNSLFSLTPLTKGIGKGVTSGAQDQINEGILKIEQYNNLAGYLQIGGIILVLGGAAVAIFMKKNSRRS